ncbi:MAG TPA: hypothetical protein VGH40_22040 [Roseiarcus sp.]|jgi:hypothetical protein
MAPTAPMIGLKGDVVEDFAQIVGVAGSVMIVSAFFCDQQGWLASRSLPYLALNLVGSLSIIASLFYAWNLPSVLIEGFWAAITVYGLVRRLRPDPSQSGRVHFEKSRS